LKVRDDTELVVVVVVVERIVAVKNAGQLEI
jgi:hypothetical protein